jgi:hypothetical protein
MNQGQPVDGRVNLAALAAARAARRVAAVFGVWRQVIRQAVEHNPKNQPD